MTEFNYGSGEQDAPNGNGDSPHKGTATNILVQNAFFLDAEIKANEKKLKPIKAELLHRIDNYPDEDGVDLEGKGDTVASISKKPETIFCSNPQKVHAIMGEAFYEIVTVPVKALKDYLSKVEIAKVTGEKYGTRRISFKKTG